MENSYEAIIAIVNMGYEDEVMSVAKEAGAKGGTVINALGSAKTESEKFFGLTIHPEKELVLIVVPQEIRDKVFQAIYKELGFLKEAQGMVFALPLSEVCDNLKHQ